MLLIFVLKMKMSCSGRNINKIMSEYILDYRLLQLLHVFNIKAKMDIMYKGKTLGSKEVS